MPDLKQWIESAGKLARAFTKRSDIVAILDAEPDASAALLEHLVKVMRKDELETFEEEFLHHCSFTILDIRHRRRAMEIYGQLKVMQYQRASGQS